MVVVTKSLHWADLVQATSALPPVVDVKASTHVLSIAFDHSPVVGQLMPTVTITLLC